MDVRSQVKQTLRMCGHAVVSTVHERLNAIDQQIGAIQEQNTSLARSQTALLQSCMHVVETLQEVQKQVQTDNAGAAAAVREQRALLDAWADRLNALSVEGLRRATQERLSNETQSGGEGADRRANELLERVSGLESYTRTLLEEGVVRQVCVETSDYAFINPEMGLMSFLYSHLPTNKVLDIGAHVGDVAEHLLQAGFEVWACEPYPPSYEALTRRMGRNPAFHPLQVALGRVEADLPLHLATDLSSDRRYQDATAFNSLAQHSMPEDLPFTSTVLVPVKTIATLQKEGAVPADLGIIKIDTEGYDLEVVRGMGGCSYPVVGIEFWDTRIPFGKSGLLYTFEAAVAEMRKLGYRWFIVLYRIWGRNHTAFYSNHGRAVPESWGNVFFFRDYETFAQGQAWCSAALPRTYFKPAASA